MALRHRPMRPKDVEECVEIVAGHPLLGPQYGSGIGDLRSGWRSLLGREAFRAVVFEGAKDSEVQTVGVGVSVFVSDEFLFELKTPPFFCLGLGLSKRILFGNSPLLSDKQVRQANATGGLNPLTWVGDYNADYLQSAEGLAAMIALRLPLTERPVASHPIPHYERANPVWRHGEGAPCHVRSRHRGRWCRSSWVRQTPAGRRHSDNRRALLPHRFGEPR